MTIAGDGGKRGNSANCSGSRAVVKLMMLHVSSLGESSGSKGSSLGTSSPAAAGSRCASCSFKEPTVAVKTVGDVTSRSGNTGGDAVTAASSLQDTPQCGRSLISDGSSLGTTHSSVNGTCKLSPWDSSRSCTSSLTVTVGSTISSAAASFLTAISVGTGATLGSFGTAGGGFAITSVLLDAGQLK